MADKIEYDLYTLSASDMLDFYEIKTDEKNSKYIDFSYDFNNKITKNSILQSTNTYGDCAMFDQLKYVIKNKKCDQKDLLKHSLVFVDFSDVKLLSYSTIKNAMFNAENGIADVFNSDQSFRAAAILGAIDITHIGFTIKFEDESNNGGGKEVHFVPFERSASMARSSHISFIDETILDEINKRLNIGIDFERKEDGEPLFSIPLSKYYSYRGLYFTQGSHIKTESDCEKPVDSDYEGIINTDSEADPDNDEKEANDSGSRSGASKIKLDEESVIVLSSESRDIKHAYKLYTYDADTEFFLWLEYNDEGQLESITVEASKDNGEETVKIEYDSEGKPDEDTLERIAETFYIGLIKIDELLKISSEPFDGEGLISPDYAELINIQLKELLGFSKSATSFQIRMPFAKGMLHEVDFNRFLSYDKSKFNFLKYLDLKIDYDSPLYVFDTFGIPRDLRKAKIIMNDSMFKCSKWLKQYASHTDSEEYREKYEIEEIHTSSKNDSAKAFSWDPMKYYFDKFRTYGHGLFVANTDVTINGSDKVKLNYQFLSTLKLIEKNTIFEGKNITIEKKSNNQYRVTNSEPSENKTVKVTVIENGETNAEDSFDISKIENESEFETAVESQTWLDSEARKIVKEYLISELYHNNINKLIQKHKNEITDYVYEAETVNEADETDPENGGVAQRESKSSFETAVTVNPDFKNDPHMEGIISGTQKGLIGDLGKGKIIVPGEQRFLSRDLFVFLTDIIRKTDEYCQHKDSIKEKLQSKEKELMLNANKMFLPSSKINLDSKKYYAVLRNPHLAREEQCALRPFSRFVYPVEIIVDERADNTFSSAVTKYSMNPEDSLTIRYKEQSIVLFADDFKEESSLNSRLETDFKDINQGITGSKDYTLILNNFRNAISTAVFQTVNKQFGKKPSFFHDVLFGHLEGVIMTGYHSLAPEALSGADFDGDIVKIIDEPVINQSVLDGCYRSDKNRLDKDVYLRNADIIKIPGLTEDSKPITRYPLYSNIFNSFSNKIGQLSYAAIKIGKIEYSDFWSVPMGTRCAVCTIATGLEIDAAKTGWHPTGMINSIINDSLSAVKCFPYNYSKNDYFISCKDIISPLLQVKFGHKLEPITAQTKDTDILGQNTKAFKLISSYTKSKTIFDFSESFPNIVPNLDYMPYNSIEMLCNPGSYKKSGVRYSIPEGVFSFETEGWEKELDSDKAKKTGTLIKAYKSVLEISSRIYRGNEFRKKVTQKNAGAVRNTLKLQYDDITDKLATLDGIYDKIRNDENKNHYEKCRDMLEKVYEHNWIFLSAEERSSALDKLFGNTKLTDDEKELLSNFDCGGYMLLPYILTDVIFSSDTILSEKAEEYTSDTPIDERIKDSEEYKELYKKFYDCYIEKKQASDTKKELIKCCRSLMKKTLGKPEDRIKYCWKLRKTVDRNGSFFWACFNPSELKDFLVKPKKGV